MIDWSVVKMSYLVFLGMGVFYAFFWGLMEICSYFLESEIGSALSRYLAMFVMLLLFPFVSGAVAKKAESMGERAAQKENNEN